MIKARVVNPFQAVEHNNHFYKAGDTYPAQGFQAEKERVQFLSKVHPKYKKIYLTDVQMDEPIKVDVKTFPEHVGGGYYKLSNGTRVKGKEKAIEAENALKSGE